MKRQRVGVFLVAVGPTGIDDNPIIRLHEQDLAHHLNRMVQPPIAVMSPLGIVVARGGLPHATERTSHVPPLPGIHVVRYRLSVDGNRIVLE
ncbi:hypothetical protein D3C74_280570 [compost metagenome]